MNCTRHSAHRCEYSRQSLTFGFVDERSGYEIAWGCLICKIHAQLSSHSTGLVKAVLLLAMKTRKTRRKTKNQKAICVCRYISLLLHVNRPFAASHSRDTKPPCWRAEVASGQDKQRKLPFQIMYVFCLSCPSATFALQHGGFVPREWLAKGLLLFQFSIWVLNLDGFFNFVEL